MAKSSKYLIGIAIFLGFTTLVNWQTLHMQRQIFRANMAIYAQDTGWGTEVSEIIGALKREVVGDIANRQLAEILLDQQNGSLVAEGMVIVANSKFQDGDKILNCYITDRRWNYWFSYNHDFAKVSLIAWKIKMNRPLTPVEQKIIPNWHSILKHTFQVSIT